MTKNENIEKAMSEFCQFSNGITDLTIIYDWYKYHSKVIGETDVFVGDYKHFKEFNKLKTSLDKICELKDQFITVINALEELKNCKNKEGLLLSWLFKHQEIKGIATYGFEILDNHLVKLSFDKTVIIDCSNYNESLQFSKVYDDLYWMFLEKYRPTVEHFKHENDYVVCTLENYLSLHNVYPEILLKYKK